MTKQRTVLITGVTGLIGSYLSMIMLKKGYKVFALARPKDNICAADRIRSVLGFWDEDALSRHNDSLIVLDGDIVRENLGLDRHTVDILKIEVDEIFHSAAVTKFNLPLEKIREINVHGTKNVLELAVTYNKEGKLKKVNHFSTAYVCGDYNGTFRENDLDVGQGFNSSYEQSKFEAEKMVNRYRNKGLWVDVYRPPLVVGESVSGKINTFQQSVHQLFHIWNLEIFTCLPGKGFLVNMVFVDELCNAVFKLSSNESSVNSNYHPFSPKALPLEDLLDISSELLGFIKPQLVSRIKFPKNQLTPAQRLLLENNIFLFNGNVRLNSTMTNKILKQYGFNFSVVTRKLIFNLFKYCIDKKFISRTKVERVLH